MGKQKAKVPHTFLPPSLIPQCEPVNLVSPGQWSSKLVPLPAALTSVRDADYEPHARPAGVTAAWRPGPALCLWVGAIGVTP